MSGGKILEQIELVLRSDDGKNFTSIYLNIYDNSLSRKWLSSLNDVIDKNLHLEKNYCFLGFDQSKRNGELILDQVNKSIDAINQSSIGYKIDDLFTIDNCLYPGEPAYGQPGKKINHDKFNQLHRYFEELQGVSGNMPIYYHRADPTIKWHIRQLNLLCHEFESWALSWRKSVTDPEWKRPSTLMCWLNAPRFLLDQDDFELFGIDTINRSLGGVYVGVNKAVGKHHWEVFMDEGRDSRIDELTTTTLRSQTEAAADFDIEWGQDPGQFDWQKDCLTEFREWLIANNFDPDDKNLTIGHPKIGQIDLMKSFGTEDYSKIWEILSTRLDVYKIKTSTKEAVYNYRWSDPDFIDRQIAEIRKG